MKKCSSCKIDVPLSEFYARSSRCKSCVKSAAGAWYLAHKASAIKRIAAYQKARPDLASKWRKDYYYRHHDELLERCRNWARDNPEKRRISRENWNNANRERIARVGASWVRKNRDKVSASWARYHAAKLRAIPKWANQFVIGEAYHLAKLRTKILGYPWHVDHIVPLISKKVCGLHVENNLQVIPGSLNMSKGNRTWPDMA